MDDQECLVNTFIENEQNHPRPIRSRITYNWVRKLIYVIGFFMIVFAIFAVVFQVNKHKDHKEPVIEKVVESRVEIFPKPQRIPKSRDTIRFFPSFAMSWKQLTKEIDDALKPYRGDQLTNVDCDFKHPPAANKSCKVDLKTFDACNQSDDYGYSTGKPCLFLKFKKDVNFKPEYIEKESGITDMIQNTMNKDPASEASEENLQSETLKTIWVACEPESFDEAVLIGPVEYIPWNGFYGYFLPYQNQADYLEPLIALRFPNVTIGQSINIDCMISSKNYHEILKFALLIHPNEK